MPATTASAPQLRSTLRTVGSVRATLGEGLCWSPREQSLYWVDKVGTSVDDSSTGATTPASVRTHDALVHDRTISYAAYAEAFINVAPREYSNVTSMHFGLRRLHNPLSAHALTSFALLNNVTQPYDQTLFAVGNWSDIGEALRAYISASASALDTQGRAKAAEGLAAIKAALG